METKTIFINLQSLDDIKKAEKEKTKLENKGFKLIKETSLFTQARLYYIKEV